jgi:DNA helicase-2/ATP-dependent DNA helicase PcrA
VRASFQMREFEDRFVTLGLPYRVIGGPRFYERAEIRDALAYLRVVNSSRPTTSPSSASSTRPSAASATPPCRCCTTTPARRIPLLRRPRIVETDEMKPKPAAALRDLVSMSFERWRPKRSHAAYRARRDDARESGYTDMWQKDRSADAPGRLENLKELVRSMEEFENLQGFLEHISLVMDREQAAPTRMPSR